MKKIVLFQNDFEELWMACESSNAKIQLIFFFPTASRNLFEIMRWQCTFVRFV
jgi:hypothetical protein